MWLELPQSVRVGVTQHMFTINFVVQVCGYSFTTIWNLKNKTTFYLPKKNIYIYNNLFSHNTEKLLVVALPCT